MRVYHTTQATAPNNPTKQVSTNAWNEDHTVGPYNLGVTGSVDRTLESKLGDFVSVKDFGAVGDGTTDDTAAFVAAWAAVTAISGGYPSLYIPRGHYNLATFSASFVPVANMTVYGDGMDSSRISFNNLAGVSLFYRDDSDPRISNVTFRDFHVDGGHGEGGDYTETAAFPFLLYNTDSLTIERVKVTRSRNMGIAVRNSSTIAVRGCLIRYAARDGINTGDCTNVLVSDNVIEYVDDDAIAHATQTYGVVDKGFLCTGNIIRFAQGIRALSASSVAITGNMLEFCMSQGISVSNLSSVSSTYEGRSATCGVVISGNTIKNCIDRASVDNLNQEAPYIRIAGASAQAGGLAAIPGENDTGTGTVISPYPYFGNPNGGDNTLPVPGSYSISVVGNTFVRDIPTGVSLSSLGYGVFYTRNGPVDIANITAATVREVGVIFGAGLTRNVLISGNLFSGIGSAFEIRTGGNHRGVMISGNVVFDCDGGLSAAGSEAHNVYVSGNTFDLDPFHSHANRGANGTWLADGAPTVLLAQSATGFSFGGNVIRNACRIADVNLNNSGLVTGNGIQVLPGNVVECDPSAVGFSTSNRGLGNVIRGGTVQYRIVDCDPASATFRQVLNNCAISFSTPPSSGKYVVGHVVMNNNPAVAGGGGSQYIITGWARMTTGSGHVLNTDWRELRTLTGT